MAEISYTLTLLSDAEPGSGFGSELINVMVPRGADNLPVFTASHLKGIIRENLLAMGDVSNNGLKTLIDEVFGLPGIRSGLEGTSGDCRFSDAKVTPESQPGLKSFFNTRTRLDAHGKAADTSLRTSEAIPVGIVFHGVVRTYADEAGNLLLRLGLLSLDAVGGRRNRGCGECLVEINGESRTPGALFKELVALLPNRLKANKKPANNKVVKDKNEPCYLKLTFMADSPVCLPELPIVGNNTIRTGLAITAGAVQGMVLYRINALSESCADACFMSENFRTWPLLPVAPETNGIPVRVPASYRMSKLPASDTGKYVITDVFIKKVSAEETHNNSPLKSVDGIIISDNGTLQLYRAGDIPRIITAQGVHNGIVYDANERKSERNLFTVESIAPTQFSGIIALPRYAEELFRESIEKDNYVQFGKSRSVRGGGVLCIDPAFILDGSALQEKLDPEFYNRLFIVQSPLLLPDELIKRYMPFQSCMERLVDGAGWGKVVAAEGSISVLFGWNRHGKGTKGNGNNRVQARYIITPGSVFLLEDPVENLTQKLLTGIGGGKASGYGAVLPHPGVAVTLYNNSENIQIQPVKSENNAGEIGFGLHMKNKTGKLSASQIGFFMNKLSADKGAALAFLQDRRNKTDERKYAQWKEVRDDLIKLVETDMNALKAVRVWHDLTVAYGEERSE